jgi:hypothetical protein
VRAAASVDGAGVADGVRAESTGLTSSATASVVRESACEHATAPNALDATRQPNRANLENI